MADMERLPWRVEGRLARALGGPAHLEVCSQAPGTLPIVRCVLGRPVMTKVSLTVRVHSRAGIPLAHASVDVNPGDSGFQTTLALLAMEGYSHLGRRAREDVERRVWSRRAYASGSPA
jgi:hypothetical protein